MLQKIVIGADHRGYDLKEFLKKEFNAVWIDVGCYNKTRTDYPQFAKLAVKEILSNKAQYGILICGSGAGMTIAANRYKGIYAATVWNSDVSKVVKEDDNINVLVFPSDYLTQDQALESVRAWVNATFKGGRYQERLNAVDKFKL